jgi:hypothetical protein
MNAADRRALRECELLMYVDELLSDPNPRPKAVLRAERILDCIAAGTAKLPRPPRRPLRPASRPSLWSIAADVFDELHAVHASATCETSDTGRQKPGEFSGGFRSKVHDSPVKFGGFGSVFDETIAVRRPGIVTP